MTAKALAARSLRVRTRQAAVPSKELSMRVANDKVRYRIESSDDIERKKQHEMEEKEFHRTIMANRIQIEWRMSVNVTCATSSRHYDYRNLPRLAGAIRMLSHLAAAFIPRQWRRYRTRRHAVLLELYEIAVRYIQRRVRWRQARHRARKTLPQVKLSMRVGSVSSVEAKKSTP